MPAETSEQLSLGLNAWGGRRRGAGRKPSGKAGVPHLRRSTIHRGHPVHVTTRLLKIRTLRRGRCYRAVRLALAKGCLKPEFRVVEFSVMHNHLHLICEATDRVALSRGLQGLLVRIAKALNRTLGRKGQVFADRYHDHVLTSTAEVRNALAYVLLNARRHAAQRGRRLPKDWVDPRSSASEFWGWKRPLRTVVRLESHHPLPQARSWLLTEGWTRHGLIAIDEVPGRHRRPQPVSG
jgi:REP element-mobilizing transposase RayT